MPYQEFPAHERDPLLGGTHDPNTTPPTTTTITNTQLTRLHTHLTTPLTQRWTDLLLLICYIITGLLDSSAVFIWGSFVSMQTGNTVYAGLGLTGLDPTARWQKSLLSIGSFCAGSVLFAGIHRHLSRTRGALALSFALQTACIAAAATITSVYRSPDGGGKKEGPLEWTVAVPLALVALQSSGQAVASRVLGFSALTSVVLTSIYCDLFSGPVLQRFSWVQVVRNPDEWRRLGAVVGLLLGVVMGAAWARSEAGLEGALWTAVGLKGLITVTWLWWRGEKVGGGLEE
ncbi:hypothetical protein ASPACDRAFT_115807 [Aspergillus aculeatus ATCC 16872]|uniref:DUF1275 domain protein n=1 Tax=Aspergillus aculeatus (strain ATCC 16872 / CBS 172.66 / WB 5094) TaxID=690307 RepID=A0A1L9WY62_ASPA1|nr:uncharacterized protein ASPACDRAFT_115807 [Aspergillus aculeatus ATCC 16872]OJK01215.1 hypothetical protein ASPACDRAFT_115807 [Aspergillus aculeatus ATCC 16872]